MTTMRISLLSQRIAGTRGRLFDFVRTRGLFSTRLATNEVSTEGETTSGPKPTTASDANIEANELGDPVDLGTPKHQEITWSNFQQRFTSLEEKDMFPLFTMGRKVHALSRRMGLLAVKIGNMSMWNAKGERMGITVLCVDRNHVTNVSLPPPNTTKQKLWHVQVSGGLKRAYSLTKPLRYHFASMGVEPKARTTQFFVSPECVLPPGTELTARHFRPGQHVDVKSKSKFKGFQGVVKRWGFKGQSATHGVTKAHRSAGSTGTRQRKTIKGTKMAGNMGGKSSTMFNLTVYKVDGLNNLLYLIGNVPGKVGQWVKIRDGRYHMDEVKTLPFPTTFTKPEETPEDLIQTIDGANRHVEEAQLYFRHPNQLKGLTQTP